MAAGPLAILIAGALALHGVAHTIALGALAAQGLGGPPAGRIVIRSWLFPGLSPQAAAGLGVLFWGAATAGFLAAALSFWGLAIPGGAWRPLAVSGATASILGSGLFAGLWPGSPSLRRSALNTAVALIMNAAIVAALVWLGWPPPALFGR